MSNKVDKVERLLKTGEVLRHKDVKYYPGIFTGKMVKPLNIEKDFKQFKKGDKVIVFHMEDYLKFRKGMDILTEKEED